MLFISFHVECRTLQNSKLMNPEPDKQCVFPFKYRGKEYDKCTTEGWGNVYWCGITYSVQENSGWGLCKCPECGCPAPESENEKKTHKLEEGILNDNYIMLISLFLL